MRALLYAIALSACASTTAPPAQEPPASVDDGIEVRLGCTVLTRRQVDEALAVAAGGSRDEVRDRLVHDLVIRRLADERHVEVSADDMSRAIAAIAAQAGVGEDELWRAVDAQGLDREAYRTEVRDQLLRYRVAAVIMDPVSDDEVTAERERRRASGEPSDETAARMDLVERAQRAALEREISRLRALRVVGSERGCVEVVD